MTWQLWLALSRPKTLPLAGAGVISGLALAMIQGPLNWPLAGTSLLTALLLQILANLANDLGDGLKGSDRPDRLGPQRMFQAGLVGQKPLILAILLLVLLSAASGVLTLRLSPYNNWGLWLMGLASVWAALAYTLGKKPYGYLGLGDLMVAIFFGYLACLGSLWLQTGQLTASSWLVASCQALLAMAVLNTNNVRDLNSDALSGKRTLALRLGEQGARRYQDLLFFLAALTSISYAIIVLPWVLTWLALLWLLRLPFVWRAFHHSQGRALNACLAQQGQLAFLAALTTFLAHFLAFGVY